MPAGRGERRTTVRGAVGGIAGEFEVNPRLEYAYVRSGALEAHVRVLCLRVEREAKRRAPVDTGRLRASLRTDVQTVGRRVIGTVGTSVEYAAAQEFGTRTGVPARRYLGGALQTVARQLGTRTRGA